MLPALLVAPSLALMRDPVGVWLVLLVAIMASYDVVVNRIPNQLTALTAIGGLVFGLETGWHGLGAASLGGLVGLTIMGIFYLTGAVGAGDVKAMAAVSTFLGPLGAVYLFATTVMAGGLLALVRLFASGWRPRFKGGALSLGLSDTGLKLPYGLAILVGTIWTVLMRGVS
jgi:prepilin peptidase CpaA